MSKNASIGRQGEFLVAYILETYGVEVHHVDRDGADLWCKTQNTITTVQVKTCSTPQPASPRSKKYYAFNTTTQSNADWYAFVALDRELMLIKKNTPDAFKSTTRLAPAEFNPTSQRRSVEELVRGTDRGS